MFLEEIPIGGVVSDITNDVPVFASRSIKKILLQFSLHSINVKTRLLGRPQPQMYPPVALNQYKWVNRTHKHFCIYASMPHENFEIDFTPNLSSQQHVKYGSNLMKICY